MTEFRIVWEKWEDGSIRIKEIKYADKDISFRDSVRELHLKFMLATVSALIQDQHNKQKSLALLECEE